MKCDVESFYTENKWLLKFTIKVLRYLPALKKLWENNFEFTPGMKILDVGSGTGALTRTIYEFLGKNAGLANFYAFDITKCLVEELKNFWIIPNRVANVEICREDVRHCGEKLPAHWKNFDVILSSGVLEYLNGLELLDSIKQLRELLKPGGKLIVLGSRKHFINHLLIGLLFKAYLYSKKSFVNVLRAGGFDKISFWKFPFPYWHLNLWGYILVAEK